MLVDAVAALKITFPALTVNPFDAIVTASPKYEVAPVRIPPAIRRAAALTVPAVVSPITVVPVRVSTAATEVLTAVD